MSILLLEETVIRIKYLTVQDSSIGHLVTQWLSQWVTHLLILDYKDYNDYNDFNDYKDSDLDLDLDWERFSELVT